MIKQYLPRALVSAALCALISQPLLAQSPMGNPHQALPKLPATEGKIYGKVIETMDTGSYTYVHVDSGENTYWAASPPVSLPKGSMVSFVPNMPMENFSSKTLKRDFDVVYFVGQIYTDKLGDHPAAASKPVDASPISEQNLAAISRAENGLTIDEAIKQKESLAGQTLKIRGMVNKFTPQVMGKNWIHIRDASSSEDLTVTTSSEVKVGDVVLVSGKLELNKDFGFGYSYALILEDSTVTVE